MPRLATQPAATAASIPCGIAAGHGPGIEKQQFHVEHQKGDRHQVEPHIEPAVRVVDRIHAAFVRHFLDPTASARADERADAQQHDHQAGGGGGEQEHGQDGLLHGRSYSAGSGLLCESCHKVGPVKRPAARVSSIKRRKFRAFHRVGTQQRSYRPCAGRSSRRQQARRPGGPGRRAARPKAPAWQLPRTKGRPPRPPMNSSGAGAVESAGQAAGVSLSPTATGVMMARPRPVSSSSYPRHAPWFWT